MDTKERIGFIGLGNMGRPLCRHLKAAGYEMVINNRSQKVVEELANEGMEAATTPSELAKKVGSGVIFLCATNTEATEAIVRGTPKGGLFESLVSGSLVIDMGSNRVDATQAWNQETQRLGADWLDAPVSGGAVGAEAASLSIMCGGSESAFARALPLLEILGRSFLRMGESGTGQLAKLANQIIVALEIAAVSEAFTLAKAHGVDLKSLRAALQGGFAQSRVLELHGQRMIDGDFVAGGTAENQLKDVVEAARVASTIPLDLPILEANHKLWQSMIDHGKGKLDHSGLFQHYQDSINTSS